MTMKMQKLAQSILKLADTARRDLEVYTVRHKSLQVEVSDGEVETLREAQATGVGVRVIDGGRLGLAFTTRLDEGSLRDTIRLATDNAQSATPDEYNTLPSPKPVKDMDLLDPAMAQIPVDTKIQLARDVEKAARAYDPRVTKVRQAAYGDAVYEVGISNSRGLSVGYEGAYCSTSLLVVAEAEGQAEVGWSYDLSRSFDKLDPTKVGREAAAKAVEMLGAGTLTTCRVPILLAPDVAADFLDVLGPANSRSGAKGKITFRWQAR